MYLNGQMSMFEMLDPDDGLSPERQKLRRALRLGSGFQDGKKRIKYEAAKLNKAEFILFLVKEYGTGGSSFEKGWIDYSSKGFEIYEHGWENKKRYTWYVVANEILDMISTNSY